MTRQMYSLELPPGCVLRRADATDAKAIQQMVYAEPLDPTQLHWSQFWVIETDRRLVAIGQLRRYSGTQELGSLVVAPSWRGQGLGTLLVQHLSGQATAPLYASVWGEVDTILCPFGLCADSLVGVTLSTQIEVRLF